MIFAVLKIVEQFIGICKNKNFISDDFMFPNCIIIGGQKCGTTSLHYYLDQHPDIQMSRWKEIQFFIEEYEWHRGAKWYARQFKGKAKIHGESSTPYTNYPVFKGVSGKMYSLIPDAKLIYLVRDPVARAISSYLYGFKGYDDKRSLEEAFVDFRNNEYIDRGRYYFQLQQYLKYYSKEQICVVQSEKLRSARMETLQRIFRFLDVDEVFSCDLFFEEKTVNEEIMQRPKTKKWVRMIIEEGKPLNGIFKLLSKKQQKRICDRLIPQGIAVVKPEISDELRERIKDAYREDVAQLREFTGQRFQEWSL